MCQWFAPTKLLVTFETEGMGRFTQDEIDRFIIKDIDGNGLGLNLPTKFVLTANHQVCLSLTRTASYLTLFILGLCRLVVCLVLYIFHEPSRCSPLRVYYPQKELALGTNCWMGKLYSQALGCPVCTCVIGHAILQLHFFGAFMGF